jgi:ATP-binding cassette subfamily C (CFTR/MRP) protein 10
MALFGMLIMPLNAFPWVLNGLIEAWVSLRRIEGFLQLPDFHLSEYYSQWTGILGIISSVHILLSCELYRFTN